jgi:LAS superfamily LD-carboxypeptidase LdcB
MKVTNIFKPVLQSTLLTASVLILASCHGSQQDATAEHDLPQVEQAVKAPEVLADGSIRIDSSHLVTHIGTDGVFILSADKRARFRMVKAGKKAGDKITVSSGLTGKELILTGPYDSIYDGSPVRVKKTDEE